jgi:hypothetical protein
MPETTSPTDRYLAEIDRLLDLHGRERRRALTAARLRLSRIEKEERKRGASDAEAQERALSRLGKPEQVAQEMQEWTLTQRAHFNAQAVAAASIPILLAIAVIALKVLEVRRYRERGEIDIQASFNSSVNENGFFQHIRALDLYLPPRYLSLKLGLSVCLVVIALVLTEVALAFVRRRRRLSSGLALAGGGALVAAVSLQIALAFEWHRLHQGHDKLLLATILVEVGAVLLLAVFLARAAKTIFVGRLAPLAGAPIVALLVLAPLLAVGAKSGLSSTDLCTPPGYCGPSPEEVIGYAINNPVDVDLSSGPADAQGAVALKGRSLAAAIETWRTKPTTQPPPPGPTDLVVWEASWSAAQKGPCGVIKPGPGGNPLAPITNGWCDVQSPASHRGASWQKVARFDGAKMSAVAVAYRSNGRLAVAYSKPDGVWLAEAPSWRPKRLLDGRAVSVKLVPLTHGDLALAAIVSRSGRSALELIRSRGGSWSQAISEAAWPGLSMVSGASQLALLFRDAAGRLVLERRTEALAPLERRTFGLRTIGALGNLRGGEIGLALDAPLRRHNSLLSVYRIDHSGRELLTRERLSANRNGVINPTSEDHLDLKRKQLAGVVQTGRVVRALYGGYQHGHTKAHLALTISLWRGRMEFASDWPRWVALDLDTHAGQEFKKPTVRWTIFRLTLGQPSEAQLAALEAKN